MTRGPDRRALLQGGIATLAIAWSRSAFAAGPSERQTELFATWHTARKQRLPLLVVIIPPEDVTRRGEIVGGALGEAPDDLLAALLRYQPVCATREDLQLLGAAVPDTAWFAIVDTSTVPAGVRAIDVNIGVDPIHSVVRALRDALAPLPAGELATVLAEEGRTRWFTQRLPGSHWATDYGCGFNIEEVEQSWSIACGMGSMPERAARFLWFLDAENPW